MLAGLALVRSKRRRCVQLGASLAMVASSAWGETELRKVVWLALAVVTRGGLAASRAPTPPRMMKPAAV